MNGSTAASSTCFNCGADLVGPYCANCGQKSQQLNPRLSDFLHEFFHELFHVDGKFFRSMKQLLLAPGFLTREAFEGRRTRWVTPIRLYLVFSVLYFAIATAAPPKMNVSVTGSDQELAESLGKIGFQSEEEFRRAINYEYAHSVPRVMFVLVPIFAWLTGVVSRKTHRNYPQHLYFALHVHAAWFAAAACGLIAERFLPSVLANVIQGALVVYGLAYLALALLKAYDSTMKQALGRTVMIVPVYGMMVLFCAIGVMLAMFYSHGAFE
jgi:uncharacterized protein DUF3667